jgi:hypothetical protein
MSDRTDTAVIPGERRLEIDFSHLVAPFRANPALAAVAGIGPNVATMTAGLRTSRAFESVIAPLGARLSSSVVSPDLARMFVGHTGMPEGLGDRIQLMFSSINESVTAHNRQMIAGMFEPMLAEHRRWFDQVGPLFDQMATASVGLSVAEIPVPAVAPPTMTVEPIDYDRLEELIVRAMRTSRPVDWQLVVAIVALTATLVAIYVSVLQLQQAQP